MGAFGFSYLRRRRQGYQLAVHRNRRTPPPSFHSFHALNRLGFVRLIHSAWLDYAPIREQIHRWSGVEPGTNLDAKACQIRATGKAETTRQPAKLHIATVYGLSHMLTVRVFIRSQVCGKDRLCHFCYRYALTGKIFHPGKRRPC